MMYNEFAMPRAVKSSEPFNIQIYKDEELTQLIASMTDGVRIEKANITPGKLNDVTIVPANPQVQKKTEMKITFTTTHKLDRDSMIEIRMPSALTLAGQPETLIEVESLDETTGVTKKLKGKIVKSGQHIQIFDVLADTPAGEPIPAEKKFILTINDVQNQNSAKDAGDWEVSTMLKVSEQYFEVDHSSKEKSFTA